MRFIRINNIYNITKGWSGSDTQNGKCLQKVCLFLLRLMSLVSGGTRRRNSMEMLISFKCHCRNLME